MALCGDFSIAKDLIAKEGRIIMKRLVMLAVLCAFAFGMAATAASAADIKATGTYTFEAVWGDNSFDDDDQDSDFDVYQRLRTKFEFIANENLKGVLYTEVGTSTWGSTMHVATDIDDLVTIKAGYIDFNWPGTQQNIKVGHFGVALPNAVGGSIILDDELPSAVITGPITDNVSYLLGWHRLDKSGAQNSTDDELDAVAMALPLSFDGVSVAPFVLAAYAGDNYDGNVTNNITWAGVSFELTMFDPFVFKADLNYGQADFEGIEDRDGWYFATSAEYKGFDFMTPEAFFVWTSGDDNDATYAGEDQMPLLAGDWAVGSFFFGGDWGIGAQSSIDADANYLGFWTLGVSLKDISFFEGLTHTVNVLYIQGTNDKDLFIAGDLNYLNEDDSLWELDLNSAYSIYDELTAYVELGWIAPDWDNDRNINDDEAWKVSTGLNYVF
jgi:hypothetical protein